MSAAFSAKRTLNAVLPYPLYFLLLTAIYRSMGRTKFSSPSFEKIGPNVFRCFYKGKGQNSSVVYFASSFRADRYLAFGGIPQCIRFLHDKYSCDLVKQEASDDIVVDIGANVGEFSLGAWYAKRVIAIEPDPNVTPALIQNLEVIRNRPGALTKTDLVAALVGDTAKTIDFHISTEDADSSIFAPPSKTSRVVKMQMRPLSDILESLGVSHVDFLKVEAEGAEPEVLEGARSVLGRVHKVAADCSPERLGQPTCDAVEKVLKDAGFQTERKGYMVFGLNPHFSRAAH